MKEETQGMATLDYNAQIGVTLRPSTQAGQCTLEIDCRQIPSARFIQHLTKGLSLKTAAGTQAVHFDVSPFEKTPTVLKAEIPLTVTGSAELRLYDEPICPLVAQAGGEGFVLDGARAHERLTVSEVKMLANSDVKLAGVPHSRAALKGFDARLHAPITDLHTHASAQIKGADLMRIALEQDLKMGGDGITYPVELLKLLKPMGMELSTDQRAKVITVPSIKFSPGLKEHKQLQCEQDPGKGNTCEAIRLRDLTEEQRALLVRKMDVAQHTIQPFSRFDPEMYRFRNPLTKRSELSREMLLTIAKDYAKQGVRYAELSTGSMLENADWFAEAIKAVDEAQQKYGVTMRFLAGIPRDNDPADMLKNLEKIKYAARHPYLVGVDVLGYEFKSAKDFSWALRHIAQWAAAPDGSDLKAEEGWDFKRDFTIRMHAGETSKRPENVIECAKVGKEYGVKIRIAHALTGGRMGAKEKNWIKDECEARRLLVELCPPSNVAYNNISRVDKVPAKDWTALGATLLLGSDGGGALQVDATQLALDAVAAGLTLQDLEIMRAHEETFIAQQKANEAEKRTAYQKHYGQHADDKFIKDYKQRLHEIQHHSIDKEFIGRLPFLIMGAGGNTYNELLPEQESKNERQEIAVALEMLRKASRRENNAFILGRVKEEGVSGEMDRALMDHRDLHRDHAFAVAGLYKKGTTEIAKSITYCEALEGDDNNIPHELFKRATTLHPPALGIFISGSNFTSDVLRFYHDDQSHQGGLPFVVMDNVPGASKDFAPSIASHKRFKDGVSLLKAIDYQVRHTAVGKENYGNVLPFAEELYTVKDGEKCLDDAKLAQLKREAAAIVAKRQQEQDRAQRSWGWRI